ncbi:hypothetical protein DL767_010589 [Monosporascus sp. MG133]|nr:hypothetical protein DL767_010589 [Monosporascus sp. MG133]
MAQHDDVLSVKLAFLEVNQSVYSLGHERYWGDPWQFTLVKTHFNSIMQTLIPSMADELRHAFDRRLGTDTENWREIRLEETVRKIVAQAASRFIVGTPLCRNDEYLALANKITDGIMFTAFAAGTVSGFLRPLVGRLASWHTHHNLARVRTLFQPLYRERLATLSRDKREADVAGEEVQDQLQVMLRLAQKKRPSELVDLDIMTGRLAAANFVSMHQTSMTVVNTILNLVGSDAKFDTIATLRDEAERVLGGTDSSEWTKEQFARMVHTDSVARETMRINFPFGNRGLLRKVLKDGVTTKDGVRLEKGSLVSFLASPAQVDPEKFPEPLKFDPFRFSRIANGADGAKHSGASTFVSTSPEYLPFGHGRHACPGRFMVDYQLKMILTHLLKYYDIEFPPVYGGQRPKNVWMAELAIPPPGARVRIRRRKGVA